MSEAPGVSVPGGGTVRAASAAPRQARLALTRVDPLSAAKVAFVLATGIAIALIVAVAGLWVLFQVAGVFDTISRTISDVAGSQIDPADYVGLPQVMGAAVLVSVVQVVLVTALATLLAILYNLGAYFVGGLSVTLTED
jgi:hypothetical protein